MKNKLLLALALTMTALSIIGYSYACTRGGFTINCNQPNCDIKFTLVLTSDNEIEKEVADIQAEIVNDGNKIQAYITNGYPCYEAYINYTIKNKGTCPVHFTNLTIINPNPEALDITTTNHTCTWLQPCETAQGTTTVHILQPAQQNWQYQFQIIIAAECQEDCLARTIGFWKHQFSTATCTTKGHQQVSSTQLEQYLNQISAQSQIFEFTGTRKQKFQQALNILDLPRRPSMETKLKAQLLALWLNYAAGWTEGWTIEGKTAWQIIQGSENALQNHQTSQYEYWKNLCDRFNNLGG